MLALLDSYLADPKSDALRRLGSALKERAYHFVTVTPASHRITVERRAKLGVLAKDLRDVFGWNLPFEPGAIPGPLWDLMVAADVIAGDQGLYKSRVRFSSVGTDLFVHSSFPTDDKGAVFFGPDTYRFCRLLAARAPNAKCAVDVGCGSGAGGLVIRHRVGHLVLCDVNHEALRFAAINAAMAGYRHGTVVESDCLSAIQKPCDLIFANPPYVVDARARTYRDGGGVHGVEIARRITEQALQMLAPSGTFILYTGTPVIEGKHAFWQAVSPLLESVDGSVEYEEIDPDVFGEELLGDAYANAERLCVVQLIVSPHG